MNQFGKSIIITCLSVSWAPLVFAALLNLPQTPIFITNTIPPNVFFQLDDSGSMDFEVLSKANWEACAYDPNISGSFDPITICGIWSAVRDGPVHSYGNGSLKYFTYIYATSDDIYVNTCNDPSLVPYGTKNAIEACPEAGTNDWRIFSSDQNMTYYDPDLTYVPWSANCYLNGNACDNGTVTSARSNPVEGSTGFTDQRDLTTGNVGTMYEVWIDDKGFSGTRPLRGIAVNATTGSNNNLDLWDSHVTIDFIAGNKIDIYETRYSPNSTGLNPAKIKKAAGLSSSTQCYNILGPSSLVTSIFNGTLAYNSTGATGCRTIPQAQTNFANWYQYGRRRLLAAKGAISSVISTYPNFRYGFNVINNTNNLFIEMPPSTATDFTSYNNNLIAQLIAFPQPGAGTPLRSALDRVGQYYMGNLSGHASPIALACQQNYTILITDGYWDLDTLGGYVGDNDGDGISQTLADVASYYYQTNLMPSLAANQVVPSAQDPATWLHMVSFTMGFGVSGNLVPGSDGWPTPALQQNSNWGNPFTSDPAKADDLWHAAFDSDGYFFRSQDPGSAADALGTILTNVAQRNASAAAIAQNSTVLNSLSQIYQATYNSNGWQGDLFAYPISLNGVISSTASWSANCMLTGGSCNNPAGSNAGITYNNRVIITRNWTGANNGIAFRWPTNYTTYKVSGSLPTNLANFLANAPYPANTTTSSQITSNQAYGQALLDYLRGNRAQEAQNNGSYAFRNRTSLLGDIVDSSPAYIASPSRTYPDLLEAGAYSAFKTTYANRTPMIYAGANDGMLHGFNANTGAETMAYVPGNRQIYKSLPNLSLPSYSHNFFVDGSPTDADVYVKSAWRTIVVNNLQNGGQGVFALDVTNPSTFTEANASQMYLWEFSDQDDLDIGYVQSPITVAKVRTGVNQSKWAVIFGNGYNNSQADGFASTKGQAALYILFIEAGINASWVADTNYIKIPVGPISTTTPNGLAAPFAIDTNGDYVVDYVYAGDLKGNLWRFDLTSTTPTTWKTKFSTLFTAINSTAGDQPITAQPIAGAHPNGLQYGVMVYFGTGKFLEPTDNTSTGQTTQAFYAIWDKLAGATVSKSALVQQQILGTVTGSTGTFRAVTSNAINWNTTPSPQNLGWYINLIDTSTNVNLGERQVSPPILRNGNIIFTTILPSTVPCAYGGSSWLMELNAASGGYPNSVPFDVNGDGQFTSADYITVTQSGKTYKNPPAGVSSSVGMTGTPAVFLTPGKGSEVKVISGSQGLGTVQENSQGITGRQNWRQLY